VKLETDQAMPLTFATDANHLYRVNQAIGGESATWIQPGVMRLRLR
jgi:hypothetical protein